MKTQKWMAICLGLCLTLTRLIAQVSLDSVTPYDGQTGVSTDTAVVFYFSAEMVPLPAIQIKNAVRWSSNVDPNKFGYAFSAHDTVLSCYYTGTLPANARISWTLNPSSGAFLYSMEGDALPTTSGSFNTGSGVILPPVKDFSVYMMSKSSLYQQQDATTVAPVPDHAALFMASFKPPTNDTVISSIFYDTAFNTYTLTQAPNGTNYQYYQEFATQEAMDTAMGAGYYYYAISLQTDGEIAPYIQMPEATEYPSIPQIVNYDAAQKVDVSKTFTVQWNSFVNAGAMDSIMFYIENTNGLRVFEASVMAGTEVSVVLPANVLSDGVSYQGTLIFTRQFDTRTDDQAWTKGFGLLTRSTTFTIKAASNEPLSPPQFSKYQAKPDNKYELTISAKAGANLILEASDPLGTWQQVLQQVVPQSGIVVYPESMTAHPRRFYRARLN